MRTRALDTSEHDTEPTPKRAKIAQVDELLNFAMDVDSDSDDEPIITEKKIAEQNLLPVTADSDNSDCESDPEPETKSECENNCDQRSGDGGNSISSSTPSSPILPSTPVMRTGIPAHLGSTQLPRQGSNWRYERAQEIRLRELRRREWHKRRTTALDAKGKVPSRKMQKLLKDIEDSEEFAEPQDYGIEGRVEVEGEEDRRSVRRRPVRKGARKSYVGQE